MDIREIVKPKLNASIPQISPGDTVQVKAKTTEGGKERIQQFRGMVIATKKSVDGGKFTVRRVASGIGVERTFSLQSPLLQDVQILRHGQVRRAKLYYMRRLSAKQSRLKEKREKVQEQTQAKKEKIETTTEQS